MSVLANINEVDRLYVLRVGSGRGSGYTCLGFEVAERWTNGIADWLHREDLRAPPEAFGTRAGYEAYEAALRAGEDHYQATGRRCGIELVPELARLEGHVIEVLDKYNDRRTFRVGRSTGWCPAHLEIPLRGDTSGGGAVTGAPFQEMWLIFPGVRAPVVPLDVIRSQGAKYIAQRYAA